MRYRFTLGVISLLTAFLVSLCEVALWEPTIVTLGRTLRAAPSQLDSSDEMTLVIACAIPLVSAFAAYGGSAISIHAVRIGLYTRRLHRYVHQRLQATAPLWKLGIEPQLAPIGLRSEPLLADTRTLSSGLAASRSMLLHGDAGAGKSVVLCMMTERATRRRALPGLLVGAVPLPILVQISDIDRASTREDLSLDTALRKQLRTFGSAGLAARLPRLQRHQGVLVLWDDLDRLSWRRRRQIVDELDALATGSAKSRIAATCHQLYRDEDALPPALTTFGHKTLMGLRQDDIVQALTHARAPRAAARPRRAHVAQALRQHHLDVTVRSPAALAALTQIWQSDRLLPEGRGQLYQTALEVCLTRNADLTAHRSLQVLGALAAAMSLSSAIAIPIAPGADLGEAVAQWLAQQQLVQPNESVGEHSLVVSADRARDVCGRATACGILVHAADKESMLFASAPMLAACVAIWLHQQDDGLSRLSPHLLRSEYTVPVLLWAGLTESPSDLAKRLLRLADTPDTTAARAGLPSSDEVWPRAVSLALAAACEGLAQRLAHSEATERDDTHPSADEQHLRDLLDAALADVTDEAVPQRLADALRQVAHRAGAELAANVANLVRDVRLSRLLRAQLVTILGLLGSEDARSRLVEVLGEEDILVRQATHRAILLAGADMLDPLREAFRHPDARVRAQAAEVLAQFGDDAVDMAISALKAQSPLGRATAARALSILRSARAEQALSAHLDDETMQVRAAVALALGALGTTSAIAALRRHATAQDPALRTAIADALGQSGSADSLTTLELLLQDTDGRVRAAAASALGLLGDDRAVDWLNAHRQDADPQAYSAVASALRRLGRE